MLVHNGYALNSYNGYQNFSYIKVSSGNFRERGDHTIQRTDCLSKYFSFKTNEPAQMKKKEEEDVCKAVVHGFSKRGRRFSPFIIPSLLTSKVKPRLG